MSADSTTIQKDTPKAPAEKPIEPITKLTTTEKENVANRHEHILKERITGKNADLRIRAASLFISGLMVSPTRLGEKLGFSKNTMLKWRKKDDWYGLQAETNDIVRAGLPAKVADWKLQQIGEIEEDISLINSLKHDVPAKSLEGILKAKAVLIEKLALLKGEATSRSQVMVMAWEEPDEDAKPRGAIPVRGVDVTEDGRDDGRSGTNAGILAPGNAGNTGDTEGGAEGEEGGKGESIENHGGKVENNDSEDIPARVKARGGKRLSGGRTTTRTLEPGEY